MRTHYLEQRNLASLQAEYASVRSRNDALRKQVERLKTPAGIEEAARESLGLVLKGESAYVVIDPGAGKPGTSTTSASLALPASVTPTSSDPLTTLLDGIFGLAP